MTEPRPADATLELPVLLAPEGRTGRLRRLLRSARTRIVAWLLLVLLASVVLSVLVTREVLLAALDREIEAALNQEVDEVRSLATGTDPRDGLPFGPRADRIFEVFLRRNVPDRDETFLTFVDGRLFLPSRGDPLVPLEQDRALVDEIAGLTRPTRGVVDTRAGPAEYLAVTLNGEDGVAGVFAVFEFRVHEEREVAFAVQVLAGVGLVGFLLAAPLLWAVAGRILQPVRSITTTARRITESDLSRRIPVEGEDEIAELTSTVNAMLDRLEQAFTTQREFLDDAGHELRTPITIIRGHLELLGDDPAERAETMPIVMDELARMSRMVEDLLVLAKARLPDFLRLETVDVAALSTELIAKARTLGDRGWRTEATGRGLVVADRQRITQAVMQLASHRTRPSTRKRGTPLRSVPPS